MGEPFWGLFFANLPTLIAALAAAIISIITAVRLKAVHTQINSRMDELITTTKISSKAEGVKEELDRDKVPGDKIPSVPQING